MDTTTQTGIRHRRQTLCGAPSDQERAREARKLINNAGISWDEIEEEISSILQGCTAEHLQAQLAAARKFFKF